MTKSIGNAIVGQSGGPTSAINATLAGVISGCIQHKDQIPTLFGMKNGIEGVISDNLIELYPLFPTNEEIELLSLTPASALGSCRKKLPNDPKDEVYTIIFSVFEKHNIKFFFYIGGNDSMDTVAKLQKASEFQSYKLQFVGVPKTIDNDLMGTDHTPGFGSAAKYIATIVEEMIRDTEVYTVKAVTIIELMGRDAGWLTAASGLPKYIYGIGPDYIYLPEKVFSEEKFYEDIEKAFQVHPNVVICVSEGIRNAEGEYVGSLGQSGVTDVFGHKYLAGTGKVLENMVKNHFGCKVRSVEVNLPQRCAAHLLSKTDIDESLQVGSSAVRSALNGETGVVMCYERSDKNGYQISFIPKKVDQIANYIKMVPDEYISPCGNQVTDACMEYILPLIQGECNVRFEKGLPKHFIIK